MTAEENIHRGTLPSVTLYVKQLNPKRRPMDLINRITINPAILAGKPIIKGTRIPVELVLEQLGQGWSIDDILEGYPHLHREDVLACIQYAHRLVESEQVYLVP